MKSNANMGRTDKIHGIDQDTQTHGGGGWDLLVILPIVFRRWYWFLLAIVISLFMARLYIQHTMPVYRTSATVLINETEDRPIIDNSDLLQGLGLPGGMKNIHNQIMIIKSSALTERTLRELPFETEFYFKGMRNKVPIYPEMPLQIVSANQVPLPKDVEFSLNFLENNMYTITSENDSYTLQKTSSFGELVEFNGGSFSIECRNEDWIKKQKDRPVYFTIHSRVRLINGFNRRLKVELISRDGSILRISMDGTNRVKDADFLNKHIEGFQGISLDKKNLEAQRRIDFIDNQLIGISDSLSITENRLQQFRSSHRVMDLSAQGQAIIGQVTLLENERARLNLEANYYDYLADYLAKDNAGELPIIPITMGIDDTGLTGLVQELAELQGQLAGRGAGEMNPLQRNLEQRVRAAREALRETLNGLRRANSLARSENQEQINRANSQASALPVTERQLIGIERKFRLNDELYTFLLETRAQQEMQKASNRSNSEVIDPADARFSLTVSPNHQMVYLFAIFAGLFFPLMMIWAYYALNKKLKADDIQKITSLPVIGNIPRSTEKTNTVILSNSNTVVAESFRLLRSRMQFFTKGTKTPVILVTSTMPSDGKTFTSINLASAYSLLGKKTVLVGFDLRKPKIFNDFKVSNEKGVSTWLIGQDSLDDIIQESGYDNLFIIPAGPIPPNPSELTALPKTEELFRILKERFDYIIIDSSPIGVVSDTFYLASLADACIMVVRINHTRRDVLEDTLGEIQASQIKSIGLVLNDIQLKGKSYGYGSKYGYTKESGSRRKSYLLQRLKK